MNNTNSTWLWVVALIVIAAAAYALLSVPTKTPTPTSSTTSVTYYCTGDSSIAATFATSSAALALSDGRSFRLPQTMSGSGIRYEATSSTAGKITTDIVFSSEGEDAYLMENNQMTYQNCVAAQISSTATGQHSYTDGANTFNFTYPDPFTPGGVEQGYTQDWMVNATTTGMQLAEVEAGKNLSPGTNFGDARFIVGVSSDPSAVATCLSYNPTGGLTEPTSTSTINDVTYTVFHSQGAGAGQRYDTTSYRTVHDNECYALEYTIHYGVIDNYPPGSVQQLDEAAIASTLDSIVQSFKFLQ